MDLGGQVGLVTAGGGVGIGRAIALALAEHGAAVAVTDRSAERAAGVAAEIRARGGASASWALDVTARAQVDEVVAAVVTAFGRIDVLVNNAGISLPCPVVSMSDELWDRVVGVSLRGTFLMSRAVLPTMIAQRYGRIVNLASYVAFVGSEDLAHYAAAKAGVVAFTKSLAREVGRHGITVNALAPGVIFNERLEKDRSYFSGSVRADIERGTALGRHGAPEDVAGTAVFLVSPAGGFVTGATIPVTGGLSMI